MSFRGPRQDNGFAIVVVSVIIVYTAHYALVLGWGGESASLCPFQQLLCVIKCSKKYTTFLCACVCVCVW